MIYDSYSWKQDLMARKRTIIKYNNPVFLSEDSAHICNIIEKSIFYSAFIIRKLVDCKVKVSDDVDKYAFNVYCISPKKHINLLNRLPDYDNYDWKTIKVEQVQGCKICNWLIHSYVFLLYYYEGQDKIEGFYVSSDYDRNKILYDIKLKDWLKYMEFVAKDDIVFSRFSFSVKDNDFKYSCKKRG